MKNQMQVFENQEFGKVRVIEKDGQPWFVGMDITKKLGYRNSRDTISKHVDDEDKGVANCDTLRGKQNLTIINESGLYSLILTSKLPAAKTFKHWVTSEILPSVKRHGAYITDETLQKMLDSGEFTDTLVRQLSDEREKNTSLGKQVETLKPKAQFCDAILQCENAVQTSILAKDYGMSCIAFNKLLHGFGIQFKISETWVLYGKYADKGYTVTRTYHVNETLSTIHSYWTNRGRLFLYDLLKWYGILPLAERVGTALIGGDDNIRS